MDDDTQRVTACGKQVKLDGEHLADAVSPEAAALGLLSLTSCGARMDDFTKGEPTK